jgi:ComF family protein
VLCGIGKGTGLTVNRGLCRSCESDLMVNQAACKQCAIPLPPSQTKSLCGQCLKKPPEYDIAWSAFIYAQPLEWMIQQLKFNDKLIYADLLADLMMSHLPDLDQQPDCIIPVPLHNKRLRQRGYNQSYELIKPIAKKMGIKVDTKNCLRKKHTVAQTKLDAKSRRQNIKAAFDFKNINNYQYVILFDDVITTGSTMSELAKVIKKQGVKRVDAWSLVRAEKYLK